MKQYLRKQVLMLTASNLEDLNDIGDKASYHYLKGIQRGIELLYVNLQGEN